MKNPFMPMFFGDFLANTMHLSASEIGAYVLLLAHAWEHDAQVPWDRAQRIARIDNRNWKKVKEKLSPFFEDIGAGQIYHARVRRELTHAAEISRKRKEVAEQMHAKRRAFAEKNGANGPHPHPQSLRRSSDRKVSKATNGAYPPAYLPTGMSPEIEGYRSPPSKRVEHQHELQSIPDQSELQKQSEWRRKTDEELLALYPKTVVEGS